jgi:hypothetical protein
MTLQLFWPIRKIDDDLREVDGYASTEAIDSQGEIVRLEALAAALPDYMRFANIREMHQPSAVGVAKEASVDGKGLLLSARIVDDAAWRKVKAGVYKGFSIGGVVTRRDADAPHVITGVDITEISLVDRPANPDAVFAVWKSEGGMERREMNLQSNDRLDEAALKAARAKLAQKWVASDGSTFVRADEAARHEVRLEKTATFAPSTSPVSGLTGYDLDSADGPSDEPPAAGGPEYADPGYQPDRKKRYPLGDERAIRAAWSYIHQAKNQSAYTSAELAHIKAKIVAAWKARIDRDGPPSARGKAASPETLRKGLQEVARLACLIQELEWLLESVALEQEMSADGASAVPADMKEAIVRMCAVLRAMVDEGTADLLDGDDEDTVDDAPGDAPGDAIERAACGLARGGGAALLKIVRGARLAKAGRGVMTRLPRLVAALEKIGARHNQADLAHIQEIHDQAVELGAHCTGGGDEVDTSKMAGAAMAKLLQRNAALEEQLGSAVPLILQVKELVEKVAAQPAVMPPARLIAIDKGDDVARELERIAGQPPAVTAFELIKRAVREPLPFGAPLGKS